MPEERSPHSDLREFGAAIALANEIELLDSGWGGYPWEHLGDASRDIHKLIRGLREANGLIEQYEVARESSESMGRALAAAHTKLQAYEDEINERTSDQALTLRKLREEQERVGALVEQLEASQAALAAFFAEWDGDVGTYAPTDDTLALMRAASSPEREQALILARNVRRGGVGMSWRYVDVPLLARELLNLVEQLQSVEAERTYFSEQTDAMFAQKVDAEAERNRLKEQLEAFQELAQDASDITQVGHGLELDVPVNLGSVKWVESAYHVLLTMASLASKPVPSA